MKDNGILSYDEYARIETKGFTTPYLVTVDNKGQRLLFYGSEHSNDPSHPQFNDIAARWSAFKLTDNPIALVEGRFDECSAEDTKDGSNAIIQGGEAQFMVHLARRDGVRVASPEPDRLWEANELAKEFGRDKVVFYYFVRQIDWWNRFTQKPDIPVEAQNMLMLMKKTYDWDDVEFSLKRMEAIHTELFNKPFRWDDTQWFNHITSPTPQDYITNVIARRSGELRDEYILQQIQTYWAQGKSIFAVFGSSHAIRLEPALRKLKII